MLNLILFGLIISGVLIIKNKIDININKLFKEKNTNNNDNNYVTKSLMTKYEKYFYDIFVELETELAVKIVPQVNLAAIIDKKSTNRFRNELFRNIDFGIFTSDYNELILLVEINDNTHNYNSRRYRDNRVDKILSVAGIKLIKFYSNYPNRKDYVKQRVRDEIILRKDGFNKNN